MEQSQEELEGYIARRLVSQIDGENHESPEKSDAPVSRGGEGERSVDDEKQNDTSSSEQHETSEITTTTTDSLPVPFAKVEKSLASLGFFTPSSRRLKNQISKKISFTREVDGKRAEVTAEIVPSVKFGLPITADQDKYLALQQIITQALQTDGVIKNPIKFRSADLIRLLGRSTKTGKNFTEIGEWLAVMMATTIFSQGTVYKANEKKFVKDIFHVFDRVVSVGQEMPDGTIADANYVWLSEWQLQNINQNYLLPIDLLTYRELKNHIAKALVPLLQVWLFATQKAGSFEKRYDDLCDILTLQRYSSPSLIVRQLKPSLDELTRYEYLKEWRIEKTSDRKAYKIIFFHGQKFHRDRRRRLDQKQQAEAGVIVAQSEPLEPEPPIPGKLELPATKETSEKGIETAPQLKIDTSQEPPAELTEEQDLESRLVDELSTRGIMPSVAMKLLRALSADRLQDVSDYLDYYDSQKAKGLGEGFLVNLIREGKSLPANFETRRQREERLAAEDRRQKVWLLKEALKNAYEDYRRTTLDRFIAEELGQEEFERRVSAEAKQSSNQEGFWNRPEVAEQMARHRVRAKIGEQLNFLSQEDFQARELPRILAELKLDPKEVGIELTKPNLAQMETGSQNAPDGSVSDF